MHAIVLQILLTLARLIRKDQEMQENAGLPYWEALRELLTGLVEDDAQQVEAACLALLRLIPQRSMTATERLTAQALLNQIGGQKHGNSLD